jgi:hypothetical protein
MNPEETRFQFFWGDKGKKIYNLNESTEEEKRKKQPYSTTELEIDCF